LQANKIDIFNFEVVEKKLLLIEDEEETVRNLKILLELEGFLVDTAVNLETAREKLNRYHYPLIVLDIVLPDGEGLELLKYIDTSKSKVIVLTAFGTVERAVESLKGGVYDFLTKPISVKDLIKTLERAFLELHSNQSGEDLNKTLREIVGKSSFVESLKRQLPQIAEQTGNVLIRGEEGVGKTLIGELIHKISPRKKFPLGKLVVRGKKNSSFELDSLLFGSEILGKERLGLLETSSGGSLLLVGIEDLPLKTQEKLLEAIEKGYFTPLGSNRRIKLNIRFISTTTKNLYEMAQKGLFNKDLLMKLNEIELEIPPLRERKEDILPLLNYFLDKFATQRGLEKPKLTDNVIDFLLNYEFPGNVMELKNMAERLVLLKSGKTVEISDLNFQDTKRETSSIFSIQNWKKAKKQFEKEYLKRKLIEANGNVKKVAQMVNLDVSNIYRKIREYNLEDYLKK